jgi:hypothetical protein
MPVVHPDLRISPRIFENILNDPNVIFRGLGKDDLWKKPEAKTLETLSLYDCSVFTKYFCKDWVGWQERHIVLQTVRQVDQIQPRLKLSSQPSELQQLPCTEYTVIQTVR